MEDECKMPLLPCSVFAALPLVSSVNSRKFTDPSPPIQGGAGAVHLPPAGGLGVQGAQVLAT